MIPRTEEELDEFHRRCIADLRKAFAEDDHTGEMDGDGLVSYPKDDGK